MAGVDLEPGRPNGRARRLIEESKPVFGGEHMRVANMLLMGLAVAALSAPVAQAQTRRGPDGERRTEAQLPWGGRASMIGVRLSDVNADQVKEYKLPKAEGALVEAVSANSPASAAGIHEKDVVVEFDGERVRSASHLTRLVAETPVGRSVAVVVVRDGRRTNLQVTTAASSFDMTFGGMIDQDRLREYAEEAGRAAREMGRTFPDVMGGTRDGMMNRARLGISVQELTPELAEYFGVKSGVLVAAVQQESAAAKAGLKAGDVITAIDGKAVGSPRELVQALPSGEASHDVNVTYVRDKHERSVKATVEPASRDRSQTPRRGQRV
jgi:serine protease Do